MNNKIFAVAAALIMVASGLAVIAAPTQGEGDGTQANPLMLVGSVSTPYQVAKSAASGDGGNGATTVDNSFEVVMNINNSAFNTNFVDIGVMKVDDYADNVYPVTDPQKEQPVWLVSSIIEVPGDDTADPPTSDVPLHEAVEKAEFDVTITIDSSSSDKGIYKVKFEPTTKGDAQKYLFIVQLRDVPDDKADNKYGQVDLFYYYGAHIQVVESDKDVFTPVVRLYEDDEHETLVSAPTDPDTQEPGKQTIEIPQEVAFKDVYAFLQTTEGDSPVIINAEHDFYAEGLPLGIAMKTDGVIGGKVAASVPADTEGTFTVYAVNKENGVGIWSGEFAYKIVPADDSFTYDTGDGEGPVSYSVPGYRVMKNTDTLEITLKEIDGSQITDNEFDAEYSLNATEDGKGVYTEIGVTDGKVSIDGLENYTGVLQVHITKNNDGVSTYTAIIHVLVVGPVVHSGLAPAVTSA